MKEAGLFDPIPLSSGACKNQVSGEALTFRFSLSTLASFIKQLLTDLQILFLSF